LTIFSIFRHLSSLALSFVTHESIATSWKAVIAARPLGIVLYSAYLLHHLLRATSVGPLTLLLQLPPYFLNANITFRNKLVIMSPNSDNAMARFLFAILKQKNLRDVGFSSSQPITDQDFNSSLSD
jgi:hypothetical protein